MLPHPGGMGAEHSSTAASEGGRLETFESSGLEPAADGDESLSSPLWMSTNRFRDVICCSTANDGTLDTGIIMK